MLLPLSLLVLALPALTSASAVLFPIYFYPTSVSETGCWKELRTAAKLNPTTLPWIIILNPNSGPITDVQDDYLRCIPYLRRDLPASTRFIGYIPTGYTNRASSLVTGDLATYKKWSTLKVNTPGISSQANLGALNGIFFDEATDDSSAAHVARYKSYAASVRSSLGSAATVVLNPGTKAAAAYYPFSSYIVTYESAYSAYSPTTSVVVSTSTPASKQIIMVHGVPTTTTGGITPTTRLTTLLDQLILSLKVGGVFVNDLDISKTDVYASFAPDFVAFTNAVAYRNKKAANAAKKQRSIEWQA